MNGPHVSHHHGRYTVEWGDPERAILELDYLRSDHGDVTAEITATSTAPSIGGVVHVARVNLLSTRSLSEFASHVTKRAPGPSTDWAQLLGIAAREVVLLHRRGEPAVLLRDVEPAEDDGYVLPPLAVARMPTILFGDGGAAKSMIALAVAASIQTGGAYLGFEPSTVANVGYLDWEMDGHEHRGRLGRLAGTSDERRLPGIVYIPMGRPLADDVDRIRREIIRHDIGYLIVDSVGLACDGPPEAAEVAIRFFGALRELGLGSLLVAHVNRSGDTERPFGSAFWHNGGRRNWYCKLEADVDGTTTIGLFCKKANTGPKPSPMGYRIDWRARWEAVGDRITITRTDVADIPDISKHVPLTYRITDLLKGGALTIHEIAEVSSADADTVGRTLRRMREKGQAADHPGPDGVMRWGLPLRSVG